MRTVADLWESFKAEILLPINAPPNQKEEMRRAFYSGVKGAMKLMTEDIVELSEAAGAIELQRINQELDRFIVDLYGKGNNA